MGLDPVTIGIGSQLIGGVLGQEGARADRSRQEAANRAALEALQGVRVPTAEELQTIFQNPELVGQLTPEMQEAISAGPTAYENISLDPRLQQAQQDALSALQARGEEGLTATERAALNQIKRETAGQEQARQASIIQNMAERGAGGSGVELAARLASSQGSAQRESESADRLAAQAQERALQAIMSGGELAGSMSQKDLARQEAIARARDAMNQFNVANQRDVESTNVSALNQAQLRNLQEQQRIAEAQTDLKNKAEINRANALKDIYDMKMGKAGGISRQQGNMADYYGQRGATTAQTGVNIGAGVGAMLPDLFGKPTPTTPSGSKEPPTTNSLTPKIQPF